jgi:hypothetical protein
LLDTFIARPPSETSPPFRSPPSVDRRARSHRIDVGNLRVLSRFEACLLGPALDPVHGFLGKRAFITEELAGGLGFRQRDQDIVIPDRDLLSLFEQGGTLSRPVDGRLRGCLFPRGLLRGGITAPPWPARRW